jgi:hypothetical protein
MQFLQPQRLMLTQQFDDRQSALDGTYIAGFCLALHRFELPKPVSLLFYKAQQDAGLSARLKSFADNRAVGA